MSYILILLPFVVFASGIFLYRQSGKRDIFKLDLIQFFYAFVVTPLLYVWGKSVLYTILQTELGDHISQRGLFLYDTVFTLIFLYVYAFVVMHSLTASFNIKMWKNPNYNLFLDSEYLHLWLTHIVGFIGGLVLFAGIGLVNGFIPLPLELSRQGFYLLNIVGFLSGILIFMGIIPLSDPNQSGKNFRRMMKLSFGALFLLHLVIFQIVDIPFNSSRVIFWITSFSFSAMVLCSAVVRSSKVKAWFEQVSQKYKRQGWDFRAQLFGKRK
jgi:hypothetical protein